LLFYVKKMSVNVNDLINSLSQQQRQKIIKDLTIDYQESEFGRKPSFHLFDIEETNISKNICVPFSYHYHNLSHLQNQTKFPNQNIID